MNTSTLVPPPSHYKRCSYSPLLTSPFSPLLASPFSPLLASPFSPLLTSPFSPLLTSPFSPLPHSIHLSLNVCVSRRRKCWLRWRWRERVLGLGPPGIPGGYYIRHVLRIWHAAHGAPGLSHIALSQTRGRKRSDRWVSHSTGRSETLLSASFPQP